MLTGLSVYDGSMSASVKWRRVWWRCAGLGMLVVAVGFATIAGSRLGIQWLVEFTIAAFAAAIEGVRLLRRNRKSPDNVKLHKWAIGAWMAAAMVFSPISACFVVPAVLRRWKSIGA